MTTTARTIEIQQFANNKKGFKLEIPESLGILDNPTDKAAPGCGVIRVMTPADGDKRVVWNSGIFAEINDAKEMFDKLVLEGLVPYRVGLNGKSTSEVMSEFDPHAEEIIFLPIAMVVGG
jgi:hypothetical protein